MPNDMDLKGVLKSVIALSGAIGLALGVVSLSGGRPVDVLEALVFGAFGTRMNMASTLVKSVPLLLTGLSVAVAFRAVAQGAQQPGWSPHSLTHQERAAVPVGDVLQRERAAQTERSKKLVRDRLVGVRPFRFAPGIDRTNRNNVVGRSQDTSQRQIEPGNRR